TAHLFGSGRWPRNVRWRKSCKHSSLEGRTADRGSGASYTVYAPVRSTGYGVSGGSTRPGASTKAVAASGHAGAGHVLGRERPEPSGVSRQDQGSARTNPRHFVSDAGRTADISGDDSRTPEA